ncbi:MAG: DUF4040 domain-containing protein [DPANN group archaeon]|nr:DUF4040 domain-containing protein [DPANN group archaeon]
MFYEALLIAAIVMALVAIEMKDLLQSVILLGSTNLIIAIVFFMLKAPDIAITQAAVIGGVVTMIFVVAIKKTERFEK